MELVTGALFGYNKKSPLGQFEVIFTKAARAVWFGPKELMIMNKTKRLLALAMTLLLAVCLFAGCGEEMDEGEVDNRNVAAAGGSISWPEGFDSTARFSELQKDGTLYVAFNNVQSPNSGYFTPASDTITIVGRATTESENRTTWRVMLWQEVSGAREYVKGGTLYLTADGSCYTGTISGLDTGRRYKIGLGYDGGRYNMSGGVTVSGIVTG